MLVDDEMMPSTAAVAVDGSLLAEEGWSDGLRMEGFDFICHVVAE